jgi:hypothetical protein
MRHFYNGATRLESKNGTETSLIRNQKKIDSSALTGPIRGTGLIIALILLLTAQLSADDNQKSVGRIVRLSGDIARPNTFSIFTEKSYNTYHWNGITLYRNLLGPLYFDLSEQFSSSLVRTDRNLITDQNSVNIQARYRISDALAAASTVTSFSLSDNRSIGGSIGKASSHGFYGGIAYTPFEGFVIEPLIGIRFDNQLDRYDKGTSYILGLELDTAIYSGYLASLTGTLQYDAITPRTLETHRASLGLKKDFSEQAKNDLNVAFYRNRRDFYLSADSSLRQMHNIVYNIESRADNILSITDSLRYNASNSMSWTLEGNVYNRTIKRSYRYKNITDPESSPLNTAIDELKIEGTIRGIYRISNFISSTLAFSYLERDEKHKLDENNATLSGIYSTDSYREERKNNHARRSNLAAATTLSLSQSDSVGISGSATILHYDTPSKENDDDRDELWYIVNIASRHIINKHLTLYLSANLALTHLVYLFSTRSADNNWNRILQFAPTVVYTPARCFTTKNTFEVLANYTVYDFEQQSSLTRSYAFRQFAFIDSSSLRLSRRLGIVWDNHIRLYERGEFRWNTFSEKPVNYFEDKLYHGAVRYMLTEGLHFSVGIRYFSQLRFGYEGRDRFQESSLRCIGPTTTIQFAVGATDVFLDGWYEERNQTGQPKRTNTTMQMTLSVRL